MYDGPGDGGGGDDEDDESRRKKPGKLILLPGGKSVDVGEIGAGYVVSQSGTNPTGDIIDPVSIDHELQKRKRYVEQQELVQSVARRASTGEIIDEVLGEIVEELAHLKFERRKAAEEGKNTANYTISRVTALKQLVELLLKRKEASLAERLDLKSPRFQSIFKVWMDFFYESMEKSGVDSTVIDMVFRQMKADMIDWEKKMMDMTAEG